MKELSLVNNIFVQNKTKEMWYEAASNDTTMCHILNEVDVNNY